MLVIKRKDRESVRLTRGDETITFVLIEGKRGSGMVGIEAAKDWKIDRIDNVNTDGVSGTEASLHKEGSK